MGWLIGREKKNQAKMTAVAASASGRKGGAGGDDADNNTGNATTAPSTARPPLVRRSSCSAGSAPGGGGSPNLGPQVETPQAPGPQQQHRSTPSASADLPPLHPAAATSSASGVPLVRQISDASAQQQRAAGATHHHRSNQPSVDTAAGNETLGNETLDSAYIATALAESTSAIRQTHGIAFHDDDSSMGSVVFHYGLGSTPPNDGDCTYDLPPRHIAGNRGRAGTAGTVDSGLTADGALDRSNHRLTLTANNAAGNGISTGNATPKHLQEHKQMPFRQYLPGGTQHQTSKPPQEHQHQKRWGSEMGINQTPSADYVERGKSSSLTSSGNGSEGVGANDDDEADINDDRVLPYNVRLSQREDGPQVPPPPPPPPYANMSPMRKPPLSPAKTRGAVTIPKTPPSDFSSLSASTYTTLGTRSGGGLRGMEYAELPGDRSPATIASGADVPPIPGLGVDGRSDVPPSNVSKIKHPRSPLSRKRRDGASAGNGGWFNKLAHKMRGGGSKSNTTGSYGSIEDPALAKEAKRYHDKNQAFLKRTEWHRKMQRSGNMEQAAVMAAGSNHSRTRTDFSGALDSIASISSDEITDDEERGRDARPLMAESKEEEYMRRIRELEHENRRLLRVQAMEAEVHGYSAGYGTLPTAVPITVHVDRTKNDDDSRKARVARVSCLAVVFVLLVIALLYGLILCVIFLL